MNFIDFYDRYDDEIWCSPYGTCPGCGMELEPEEYGYCYLCSSGFSFFFQQN